RDWSSDVCSSDLLAAGLLVRPAAARVGRTAGRGGEAPLRGGRRAGRAAARRLAHHPGPPAAPGRVDDPGRADGLAGGALRRLTPPRVTVARGRRTRSPGGTAPRPTGRRACGSRRAPSSPR